DGQPIGVLPAPPDLGRQRFGSGDAEADRGKVAVPRAFEVEQRVVERGRGEEKSRPALLDGVEHRGGRRPALVEGRRGANPEGEGEAVAEAVSVEELGRR